MDFWVRFLVVAVGVLTAFGLGLASRWWGEAVEDEFKLQRIAELEIEVGRLRDEIEQMESQRR